MRIGLDIDDTMSRHWPFFALISRALVDAGHEVAVVTLRTDRAEAERLLRAHGVCWTALVCADLDELDRVGIGPWKAQVCARLGLEIFFDDMPEVLNHLPAETVGLMAVDPAQGLVYYD